MSFKSSFFTSLCVFCTIVEKLELAVCSFFRNPYSFLKRHEKVINTTCQALLLSLAAWGYFYTVIPVYERERLSEQVAEKETEIKKADRQLMSYQKQLQKSAMQGYDINIASCSRYVSFNTKRISDDIENRKDVNYKLFSSDTYDTKMKEFYVYDDSNRYKNTLSRVDTCLKKVISESKHRKVMGIFYSGIKFRSADKYRKEFNDFASGEVDRINNMVGFYLKLKMQEQNPKNINNFQYIGYQDYRRYVISLESVAEKNIAERFSRYFFPYDLDFLLPEESSDQFTFSNHPY